MAVSDRAFSRRQFVAVPLVLALSGMRWPFGYSGKHRGAKHPDPRPGITAEKVLPASHFSEKPRAAKAYDMAREIPEVLDGLHCHCECDGSMGHRSLLSCFESEQASGCHLCADEMRLAHKLHKEGKSLDDIRNAVDEEFG
jgi:hypothetical protein